MHNIFWMPATLAEEDRFTTSLHFLIDNSPKIGQAIVDHLMKTAKIPATRLLGVTDHPACDNGAKPDFLFECQDFDIICEHKVASRLRPAQLETYLKIKRAKQCYVALITRDTCAVPTDVLRHARYLQPQASLAGHFRWHEIYDIVSQHKSRAARDFAEYMQMLGMAPLPTPPIRSGTESTTSALKRICVLADEEGIGQSFRAIKEAAERNGLYARPYKYSIMYTPPWNKTRMLFTVWAENTLGNHFAAYISPSTFAEFYPPITRQEAEKELGQEAWHDLSRSAAKHFIDGLDRMMTGYRQSKIGK
jgi:hypothetical protein